jgi:hypothetical protein
LLLNEDSAYYRNQASPDDNIGNSAKSNQIILNQKQKVSPEHSDPENDGFSNQTFTHMHILKPSRFETVNTSEESIDSKAPHSQNESPKGMVSESSNTNEVS